MAKVKQASRAQRWSEAAAKAKEGLQELVDLQAEYQEWRDNLPENLDSSAVAEKLDEVIGIDLEGALDTAQEAYNANLPLGFGRD